jgi:fucose 4-O-acetylase-like acetyltransferase
MTPLETKKVFIETIFWFIALTIIRMLVLLVALFNSRSHSPESARIIYVIVTVVIGNLASALVLTLLNRLLQRILSQVR